MALANKVVAYILLLTLASCSILVEGRNGEGVSALLAAGALMALLLENAKQEGIGGHGLQLPLAGLGHGFSRSFGGIGHGLSNPFDSIGRFSSPFSQLGHGLPLSFPSLGRGISHPFSNLRQGLSSSSFGHGLPQFSRRNYGLLQVLKSQTQPRGIAGLRQGSLLQQLRYAQNPGLLGQLTSSLKPHPLFGSSISFPNLIGDRHSNIFASLKPSSSLDILTRRSPLLSSHSSLLGLDDTSLLLGSLK